MPNDQHSESHSATPTIQQILVIEDNPANQKMLTGYVAKAFPEAQSHVAGTVAEARQCMEANRYQLAIVDINLPDGNGIDLIAPLVDLNPNLFTIIATIFDDNANIFKALQAGAQGYLLKDEPEQSFLDSLHNMTKGLPPLSAPIARKILKFFESPFFAVQHKEPVEETNLTPRECEVLTLISKGFSRAEVSEFLGLKQNTVSSYIKIIYKKLNVASKAEAALEARRLGLA